MRKVAWLIALVLLFGTGVVGLVNAVSEWRDHTTPLQFSVTIGVAIYSILGLVGGVGLALRRAWSVPVVIAWGVAVTYVASVASFAYSDPTFSDAGTVAGVIGAFVSGALIGAFMVWTARRSTRPAPEPTQTG